MALGSGEPRFDRALAKLQLLALPVIPERRGASSPESIATIRSMDSGPAPVAHPGMTAVLVGRPKTPALFRRLRAIRNRRTRAHQIAVAIDVVDASDRAPVFVRARSACGE